MAALQQATIPMQMAELVELLKNAHDEPAIVRAVEYWRKSGDIVAAADGALWWRGPR
jgi:hypothetical protein